MQMLAFNYPTINVASEEKFLKHERGFFFLTSVSQAAKWSWLILPNPLFGPRKNTRNFSQKVFYSGSNFSFEIVVLQERLFQNVWWGQEINSTMKSYRRDWHS